MAKLKKKFRKKFVKNNFNENYCKLEDQFVKPNKNIENMSDNKNVSIHEHLRYAHTVLKKKKPYKNRGMFKCYQQQNSKLHLI